MGGCFTTICLSSTLDFKLFKSFEIWTKHLYRKNTLKCVHCEILVSSVNFVVFLLHFVCEKGLITWHFIQIISENRPYVFQVTLVRRIKKNSVTLRDSSLRCFFTISFYPVCAGLGFRIFGLGQIFAEIDPTSVSFAVINFNAP